jgi:hypothetical protein
MYPIIGGGNVDMWHDMYVHRMLVGTMGTSCVKSTFIIVLKYLSHVTTFNSSKNQTWLTTDVCMVRTNYHIKDPIFNLFATIIQLIDFLTW